ncbi:MAG TPA: dephospho-CoA kinase [Syntrophales bacterium]|nr:dephospho-CoA kinase [Syntrophales bacterium]
MLNVGLTGGIATGKTSVAEMFKKKGAYVIDFDVLTHKLQEPRRPVWQAILDFFGRGILNDDETINRGKLGAIVFQDRIKLTKLNEIIHPFIFEEWRHYMSEIQKKTPDVIIISDIPLLIEAGVQKLVDLIVLVYALPSQQVERLIMRNGCNREESLRRIASQLPIDDKIPYADILIDNSSSFESTRQKVDEIWVELNERQREKICTSRSIA